MWQVMIRVRGETAFAGNGLRYAEWWDAEEAARDLACRWAAVDEWEIVEDEQRSTPEEAEHLADYFA
jgi:hypothetical protein